LPLKLRQTQEKGQVLEDQLAQLTPIKSSISLADDFVSKMSFIEVDCGYSLMTKKEELEL
jgi:hypothetical protein